MIPSELPVEGVPSVSHPVASSVVPEEVAEQHVTLAHETTGLRPRRTTGGTEHSYIWTTEHHLAAAAEASADTSVSLQVPDAPRAATAGQHHEDGAASAATARAAAREINPAAALGLLFADLAARLFCLSIFWMLLIVAILLSNAALSTALIHRRGLSVEAALGITVGLDAGLAAASLAFMARRLSTDIIQWGTQKLQPGKEKLERLTRAQREGNPEGGRLKGLHLQALQKRVHEQAQWVLGKAREKMKGRAPEACSSSDARGACNDASMTMEEGHTDKRDAGDEAAVLHQAKGLSLSALVSEVQKLTSLMVKTDAPADRNSAD